MTSNEYNLVMDMKHTFGTESGKRVLERLELECGAHINQDNFVPGQPDKTAYNLGKNRVFRFIKSHIEMKLEEITDADCQTEKPLNERT